MTALPSAPPAGGEASSRVVAAAARRWCHESLIGPEAAGWPVAGMPGRLDAIAAWARRRAMPLARRLDDARPGLATPVQQPARLAWPVDVEDARRLAAGPLAGQGSNAAVPETGAWTRHLDTPVPMNPWTRLLARLDDLDALLADGGDMRLQARAWPLGPGEGVACVETARGVLTHHVRLSPGASAAPVVAQLRIVSPTDWNFAPSGPVARALASGALTVAGDPRAAALVATYDPCVTHRWIEATTTRSIQESTHA